MTIEAAFSPDITDWDAAYDNRGAAADPEAVFGGWAAAAAAYRERRPPRTLAYGAGPRERLDRFDPDGTPKGAVVLFHGGYWLRFDKASFSHLAEGLAARGWAVAIPSYPLAPQARISEITAAARAAIAAAAASVPGPVRLVGHSAGGHLVCRAVCADAPEAFAPVAERIDHVVSVSGLHDLRPLLRLAMNASWGMSPAEAASESPALRVPRRGTRLTAWVGADELAEFRRQNALIAAMWAGLGARTRAVEAPGADHFSVLASLTDPAGALTNAVLD